MKRLEIRAYNLEDAKVKAFEQGITVIKNVTKDWKAAGQPILTKQLDAFGARILEENNLFPFNNAGVIIAINKGKKPLMRNIFRFVNFPKKGPRKMKRVVEIRNLDTDEFIKNLEHKKISFSNIPLIFAGYDLVTVRDDLTK